MKPPLLLLRLETLFIALATLWIHSVKKIKSLATFRDKYFFNRKIRSLYDLLKHFKSVYGIEMILFLHLWDMYTMCSGGSRNFSE